MTHQPPWERFVRMNHAQTQILYTQGSFTFGESSLLLGMNYSTRAMADGFLLSLQPPRECTVQLQDRGRMGGVLRTADARIDLYALNQPQSSSSVQYLQKSVLIQCKESRMPRSVNPREIRNAIMPARVLVLPTCCCLVLWDTGACF